MRRLETIVYAAPVETRIAVREAQDYKCAWCGHECNCSDDKLEVHHILPEALGGSDKEENLVGLCGPNANNCHFYWDNRTLKDGVFYPV